LQAIPDFPLDASIYESVRGLFGAPATQVDLSHVKTVATFKLDQNYPNPFNPSTSISFAIPTKENVNIKIYNITGKEVATLLSRDMPAGNFVVEWDASDVPSGVYFYKINAGEYTDLKKCILIK